MGGDEGYGHGEAQGLQAVAGQHPPGEGSIPHPTALPPSPAGQSPASLVRIAPAAAARPLRVPCQGPETLSALGGISLFLPGLPWQFAVLPSPIWASSALPMLCLLGY